MRTGLTGLGPERQWRIGAAMAVGKLLCGAEGGELRAEDAGITDALVDKLEEVHRPVMGIQL